MKKVCQGDPVSFKNHGEVKILCNWLKSTELSFLVILQILARAGLVGVYKKCSLVKMNHQYIIVLTHTNNSYLRGCHGWREAVGRTSSPAPSASVGWALHSPVALHPHPGRVVHWVSCVALLLLLESVRGGHTGLNHMLKNKEGYKGQFITI